MSSIDGRLVKGVGGLYTVAVGDRLYNCRARGKFKIENRTPTVGDNVQITFSAGEAYITDIHERKNILTRPRAANVDVVLIVASLNEPALNLKVLDALIAACDKTVQNAEIALCFTKSDVPSGDLPERLMDIYGGIYRTVITSSSEKVGLDDILSIIDGKTAVVCGESGVGKSSLLNALSPNVNMETGALSKIKRGKQTTRHTELFEVSSGTFIVDSPGFSRFDLNMPKEELHLHFKEFAPFINRCRYADCSHITEDGCAVKAAVRGERYDNYVLIYSELT